MRAKLALTVLLALVTSCDGAAPADDGGTPPRDAGPSTRDGGVVDGGSVDAGAVDAGAVDAGEDPPDAGDRDAGDLDAGGRLGAAAWIRAHFAALTPITGDFTTRQLVETPALIDGATACCAKYAFDLRDAEDPSVPEAGFVDVRIADLESSDGFGGGIQTSNAPGAVVFMANVTVDPAWPDWVGYSSTNYDGLVLDGSAAFYAEGLTITDWRADGAIDNKANVSQLVDLTLEGSGHRGLRFWQPGPHYLVDSRLSNDDALGEGVLMWFRDCSTVEVRVWNTTFDGETTVPAGAYSCDDGSDPTFVYLDADPRTTGEMHEMFSY